MLAASASAICPHAAQRLARCLVAAVTASRDPRTFLMWARDVGVGSTQLRGYCRLVKVAPKQGLDFARLLRVAVQRSPSGYSIEDLLDIADARTLRSLLMRAGLSHARFPTTGAAFINQQVLIQDGVLLAELRTQLELLESSRSPTP
jgi:hypothetical protein